MVVNLVRRGLVGDQRAFDDLFEQHKNLVYRTAYLLLDSREEAEDALQEVFLQAFRALGSYDPAKGAFTTWLHRITVNHCLNRRRKVRFSLAPLNWASLWFVGRGNEQVERRLEEDEEVRGALRRLSPALRAVVVLRFYQELSYAEIAEITGTPIGTVQSRLNRALREMRAAMEQTGSAGCAERATQKEMPR